MAVLWDINAVFQYKYAKALLLQQNKFMKRSLRTFRKIMQKQNNRLEQTQTPLSHLTALKEFEKGMLVSQRLEMQTSCSCKVCSRTTQKQCADSHQDENGCATVYNMFRLIIHLVLIDLDKTKELLGQLRIPMLFYPRRKASSSQHSSSGTFNSFILLQSDRITGDLCLPSPINSLNSVKKILKANLHRSPTIQQQANPNGQKFIHQSLLDHVIPLMIYESPLQSTNSQKQSRCILHNNSKYLTTSEIEPFCIFRFEQADKQSSVTSKLVNKQQILTYQNFVTFLSHQQSFGLQSKEMLGLTRIESFITVAKESRNCNKAESNSVIKGVASKEEPVVYYTYYANDNDQSQSQNQAIYEISQRQILMHLKRINEQDSAYLQQHELQALIKNAIEGINAHPNNKPQVNINLNKAYYKTYKILHVLEQYLKIIVKSLKLKWILNMDNELVLVDCLEYVIDETESLSTHTNQGKTNAIENGMQLLVEGIQSGQSGPTWLQEFFNNSIQSHRSKSKGSATVELLQRPNLAQVRGSFSCDLRKNKSGSHPSLFSCPFTHSVSRGSLKSNSFADLICPSEQRVISNPQRPPYYLLNRKIETKVLFPKRRNSGKPSIFDSFNRPKKYRLHAFKTQSSTNPELTRSPKSLSLNKHFY